MAPFMKVIKRKKQAYKTRLARSTP